MNYQVIIPAAGTYDVDGHLRNIAALVLENMGAANVVWGDVPGDPVKVLPNPKTGGGAFKMTITTGSANLVCQEPLPEGIIQGMFVTSSTAGIPANTSVKHLKSNANGTTVILSANATASVDLVDLTFTFPPLNETNGITLVPGGIERFTSEPGARFINAGLRLYSTSGSTVKIFKRFH